MIVFSGLIAKQEQYNQVVSGYLSVDVDALHDDPNAWRDLGFGGRFPSWLATLEPERCKRLLLELWVMASDEFPHELSPLQEYVLYRSLETWLQARESRSESVETSPEAAAEAEELDEIIDRAFLNTDWLHVGDVVRSVLEGTQYNDKLGIDAGHFLELMPEDVRVRVERALG